MEIRPVATALVHADRRRKRRTEGNVQANRCLLWLCEKRL